MTYGHAAGLYNICKCGKDATVRSHAGTHMCALCALAALKEGSDDA